MSAQRIFLTQVRPKGTDQEFTPVGNIYTTWLGCSHRDRPHKDTLEYRVMAYVPEVTDAPNL